MYQGNGGFIKWVGNFSLFCDFLEPFQKLFSKCWIKFACEAAWSWTFVWWEMFNNGFNFNASDWYIHVFSFFMVQSRETVLFKWKIICPFLLDCPFYWHTAVHSNLFWSLVFLWSQFVTFPFSSLILLIWVLSLFFLRILAKGSSILFTFSKNQLLVSLIFAIVFFDCIFFISPLIFRISFLLLTLGFICSPFFSCFKCKNRLFEILLVSQGKIMLL